jgi:uncharacterized membrane protein
MTCLGIIVLSGRAWLVPSLCALAVLVVALIWAARSNAAERWVAFVCTALKLAGLTALALCLLEPLQVSQRARPGANLFALIADNSQSLRVKDEGQTLSRGESLRDQLVTDPHGWQTQMEQDFVVRRYSFDSRLQNVRGFDELNFNGRASALGGSLRTAIDRWHGQPVAGVLLFTDGNATDLSGDLPALDGCPPIYPVVLGADTGLRDISVDKVSASQTAFEDAPVTVQAAVSASGFSGSGVRAELTEVATESAVLNTNDDPTLPREFSTVAKTVAMLTQRADAAESALNFRFQIQPDKPGIHFYQLEARATEELSAADGASHEATLVNNRRMMVVDRGQKPFRILCVAGRPDWEYKFLNRAMQEDPQLRMATLLRMARREPKFAFRGIAEEASNPLFGGFGASTNEDTARFDQPVLIPLYTNDTLELRDGFPKSADQLFKYDAIILDRVEAAFFTHEQMLLLRRFVADRGGGFLMIGGAESFREGGYAETAIDSMLPVYLDRPGTVLLPSLFKMSLTREGWLQPWTRLRATEADEQERLASMPAFQVLNPVRAAKPGASVLATVSDGVSQTYPALVVQRFGLGSVATLMVGDMWHWGMQSEAAQKDLGKSWRQLVRWLVSDVPSRFTVESRPTDDPAQVRLVVKARDEEFKPLDDVDVKVTVRPVRAQDPAQKTTNAPTEAKTVTLPADPSSTEPGNYVATYVVPQAGAYAVDAVITQPDGKIAGRAATGLTSDPAVDEFRTLKPNRALLESIAHRTGGEVVALDDLSKFVRNLPNRRAPITETMSDPLWHQPVVFLFALLCFVTDWGLRRWKGLP